jgi:hypothetical protein
MISRKLTRFLAAGAAAFAVAAGGLAIGNASSGSSSPGTATAASSATPDRIGGTPRTNAPHKGSAPAPGSTTGQVPKGWTPGSGTLVTGAAADKAKAVALSKYSGTVNRVLQLSDGSYAVHLFATTSGPHHVFVSKDFKITGTA